MQREYCVAMRRFFVLLAQSMHQELTTVLVFSVHIDEVKASMFELA